MDQTAAIWTLIAVALVTANLPFVNERVFALVPFKRQGRPRVKPFWLRFAELTMWFGLTGLLGRAMEAHLGNVFAQGWEFYAIAFALYIVLGYPGFVLRYLFRRRTSSAPRPAR